MDSAFFSLSLKKKCQPVPCTGNQLPAASLVRLWTKSSQSQEKQTVQNVISKCRQRQDKEKLKMFVRIDARTIVIRNMKVVR